MTRLLLHAPNVHVGGGLVLLKELLAAPNLGELWANLDTRARALLDIPGKAECHYVRPAPLDRLRAEVRLRDAARDDDTVLCFHGMPPIFASRGKVIVFQQNRNHFGLNPLSGFSGRTKVRIMLERFICRTFKRNVSAYVVQTSSMQRELIAWHGGSPSVKIFPFMGEQEGAPPQPDGAAFDFVYVASGEAHKNHRNLLQAWTLLAQEGCYPTLALTLPPTQTGLLQELEQSIATHRLRITNAGSLTHAAVSSLYQSASALVFPSTSESFGLPLLEATRIGLPIVASELDFVRDICNPVQTFDPCSPVSIARAVKRFLKLPAEPVCIHSAAEFVGELGL